LTAASAASINAVRPLVSIMPRASMLLLAILVHLKKEVVDAPLPICDCRFAIAEDAIENRRSKIT
jgi:hypothetical protein